MTEAAACASLVSDSALRLFGLTSAANRTALGSSSSISPSRLAASSELSELIPVRFPPGRLKLVTSPISTGSVPMPNTTGIEVVAALAASAAWVLPGVTITATRRRTRSASSSVSLALSLPDRGRADSHTGEDDTPVAIEVCEPLCHLTAGLPTARRGSPL
jgi:hypothetical protein